MDNLPYDGAINIPEINETLIFFGHQSIGDNILDGINDSFNKEINISQLTDEGKEFRGIIHNYIGENNNPLSKIDDFRDTLLKWPEENIPAMVFMKFCYLDFSKNTDIDEVYKKYNEAMSKLSKKYPEMMILHFTVPLTIRENLLKSFVKKILKMDYRSDNVTREKYNQMLRAEYGHTGNLFDIAALESTKPDGKREKYYVDKEPAFALYSRFASDYGHLNEKGRSYIAQKFLEFISSLLEKK